MARIATAPTFSRLISAPSAPQPPIAAARVAPILAAPRRRSKAQFSAQIADRMNTLTALRKQYTARRSRSSPLLPQEATQLSHAQLDNATPPQRAQILTALRGAMNDDQAYQAAMRQIAPHSPVTAIAGSMVGNSAPASTPMWFDSKYAPSLDDVAHVLSGDSLLNPNKATTGQQEKGETQEHGADAP